MSWADLQAEPAFGFTVLGLIIVFGPLVAERLRLPGLLGLLLLGAVVGPNVIDLLPTFTTLQAVGNIGVLYLIFLSGLQLDIDSFITNWRISAVFGGLTSVFPMVLGVAAALIVGIDLTPAILIGSFWASFTLIAYPVLTRYGLTRNRAVNAVVGASSITDTVSLVILALVVGAETGDVSGVRLVVELTLGFVVLAGFCFVVAPLVTRWFFSGIGQERTLRFMLVLVAMTSAAVVSDAVGVEPLIGAFFVGVGLNRLVPNASPLMAMTEFYGNAFFIPAFLVSVGLLFDPAVMFTWATMKLAIGFTVALLVGKLVAALLTGRIFRLDPAEVGVLGSVSVAQAAATLAATIVGLDAGLYGDDVVNAVMVVVSVSLIVTSIGTERFAARIAPPVESSRPLGEAILLPIQRDPSELAPILRLADRLAEARAGVIHPLVVVPSSDPERVDEARATLAATDKLLRAMGRDPESSLRLDRSIASGVRRAAIEARSSMMLLDWSEPGGLRSWLLGGGDREIVDAASLPSVVAALQPGDYGRVLLVARRTDLLPARLPSLRRAAELACEVSERDHPLFVGPLGPDRVSAAEIDLPAQAEHVDHGSGSLAHWAMEHSQPGDLVIVPFTGGVDTWLEALHGDGRSVLAVTENPGSESRLTGSTMAFPVGGVITP
jgi:Kef-type K+ transport system membrane component KefB